MPTNNQQAARVLAVKIAMQVKRSAGQGLNAARVFLTSRVKEALSVPAPRKAVRARALPSQKRGGILYYRATTPAEVGAPPRKLSGRMRTAQTSRMVTPMEAVLGNSARGNPSRSNPDGFSYPKFHEEHDHPFIAPTVKKWARHAAKIAGAKVRLK